MRTINIMHKLEVFFMKNKLGELLLNPMHAKIFTCFGD